MNKLSRLSLILPAMVLLAGCGGIAHRSNPMYAPSEPINYTLIPEKPATGGVFDPARGISLFSDVRAYQVGDIVNVVLVEATNAAKTSDTSLDKTNSTSITNPTVFGEALSVNNRYNLGVDMDSTNSFEGEASSNQSNSLTGSIAVQVHQVLPNGNLMVRGEKWIKINQGDEFIQLRGIIRPEDLSSDNTISSTRIADARISYSGTGIVQESNQPGWLARFFNSPLSPF